MGGLHEGHESLINRSKKENHITVVSIYVNPAQFEDNNDFTNYLLFKKAIIFWKRFFEF